MRHWVPQEKKTIETVALGRIEPLVDCVLVFLLRWNALVAPIVSLQLSHGLYSNDQPKLSPNHLDRHLLQYACMDDASPFLCT